MRTKTQTIKPGVITGIFLLVMILLPTHRSFSDSLQLDWTSIGIGGGGGIFHPSISPHDANIVFLSCDMGGIYRSKDGGHSWRMIDGHILRKLNFPIVFHPVDPSLMYAATRGGLKRSEDGGATWALAAGQFDPLQPDMPSSIAIDPHDPRNILCHFDGYESKAGNFLVYSQDHGTTWQIHTGWPVDSGAIDKIFFDPAQKGRIYLWANGDVYRSNNGGQNWVVTTQHLPGGGPENDMVLTGTKAAGNTSLFITTPFEYKQGRIVGGLYRSTDGGESWQQITAGLETHYSGRVPVAFQRLVASSINPDILYLSSKGSMDKPPKGSTIWRSDDRGDAWRPVMFGDPDWDNANVDPDWLTKHISWWWGGTALGLAADPANPQRVIFSDHGRAIQTLDGGQSWHPISSRIQDQESDAWRGQGLEVSTNYQYYFDPFDPTRTFITYTDFGLARSLDDGRTWIWAGHGSPWNNTCYELAFDPDRPGVVFGAWANAHDLPHWKMIESGPEWFKVFRGGITRSDNAGATWKGLGKWHLPDAAATSLVLDPSSPRNARTLYAAFLAKGVYRSTDDGKTWQKSSRGLGTPGNLNLWRLALHKDATLLCVETLAYREGRSIPGGLFRSRDKGDNWERVPLPPDVAYIWGVRMNPEDSDIIYLSAFDTPPDGFKALGSNVPWPRSTGGGLYKTNDGGLSWQKILDQPWCWDVTFDPEDSSILYAGTYIGGVFRSPDAGLSWVQLKGLPHVCAQRVTVDPRDRRTIYVSTFGGGMWKTRLPQIK